MQGILYTVLVVPSSILSLFREKVEPGRGSDPVTHFCFERESLHELSVTPRQLPILFFHSMLLIPRLQIRDNSHDLSFIAE